jgi:hypothetical protein
VGDGLAVSASCGQEALLRFEIERQRRLLDAQGAPPVPALIRQPVAAPEPESVPWNSRH